MFRNWKITVKEVGREEQTLPILSGEYELEDVRRILKLEEPDVEWYTIEEAKDETKKVL